jgi:hypothetical protein
MHGQWMWSIVIVVLVVFGLSEAFPGKRAAPTVTAVATMAWVAPSPGAPRFFQQVTDLATCREMQRQIAQQRDTADNGITLACHASPSHSAL